MPKYNCTVIFDASSSVTVEAKTPEDAANLAEEKTAGHQRLCHQCADTLETGDAIGVIVYDETAQKEVLDTTFRRETTPPAALVQELDDQLQDAINSLAFYRRRVEALQQWQSKMRDPERTIVCDIIANGHTLEPAGNRYTQSVAPVQDNELDRKSWEELNCAEEVLDGLSVDLDMEQTAFDCIGDYIQAVFDAQAKKIATAPVQEIQRLTALVRAQQITIEKLEAQRQWVSLTDEEVDAAQDAAEESFCAKNKGPTARHLSEHESRFDWHLSKAIEAKLREKNAAAQSADPDPLHLSRILHELAGAASMCWTPRPAGVFDSQEAIKHVVAAIDEIRARYQPPPAAQPAPVQEPVGRVVSANCEYATVQWLRQTSEVGGGDPKNSRSWPIAGDTVYTIPPAAPVQEPVAWLELLKEAKDNCKASIAEGGISAMRKEYRIDLERRLTAALATPPAAQRQWVGLTDEEIRQIGISLPIEHRFHSRAFARAIEAKLKEKNT